MAWQLSTNDKALVAVTLLFYGYLWVRNRAQSRRMLPPGPPGLPIIGNLLDMPQKDQSSRFSRWSEEYSALFVQMLLARDADLSCMGNRL